MRALFSKLILSSLLLIGFSINVYAVDSIFDIPTTPTLGDSNSSPTTTNTDDIFDIPNPPDINGTTSPDSNVTDNNDSGQNNGGTGNEGHHGDEFSECGTNQYFSIFSNTCTDIRPISQAALDNGAKITAMQDIWYEKSAVEYIHEIVLPNNPTAVFVPEGGRCQEAEFGVKVLANEINEWVIKNKKENVKIVLPSGTGTTALFLQKNLSNIDVLTCACVGGDEYLKTQFSELEENSAMWPTILSAKKKYHFGKLYPEFYKQWQQLKQETSIEFDLLYDPLGWLTLLYYLKTTNTDQDIIYIHQGGLVGNQSMLPRYQRKYDTS
mgnify:CR=1 FL=1